MTVVLRRLWTEAEGQNVAEYAVMLAVLLVLFVSTVRLMGANTNPVFSRVGSVIQ
jgi:Flp pilus assembly pilin Flp